MKRLKELLPPSPPVLTACCQHIASALENAAHLLCGCSRQFDLDKKIKISLLKMNNLHPMLPFFSFVSYFSYFSFQNSSILPRAKPSRHPKHQCIFQEAVAAPQLPFCCTHDTNKKVSMTSTSSRPSGHITPL